MLVLLGMLKIVEEFQKNDEVLRVLLSLVLTKLLIPGMLKKVLMMAVVLVMMLVVGKMFWIVGQFHMTVGWMVVIKGFGEEMEYHFGVLA